jgi:hypothetical protein
MNECAMSISERLIAVREQKEKKICSLDRAVRWMKEIKTTTMFDIQQL